MKTGNVTGAVYERSVHRKLKNENGWIRGAAHGEDCAFFECGGGKTFLSQSGVYTGADMAGYAVYSAVNRAAAWEAEYALGAGYRDGVNAAGKADAKVYRDMRCSVQVQILLPAEEKEQTLQRMVCDIRDAAENAGAAPADVKACVTEAVSVPVTTASAVIPAEACAPSATVRAAIPSAVSVPSATAACATAAGNADAGAGKAASAESGNARKTSLAGSQIVMTKWAGTEGTARLTNRCREQLLKRYPAHFLDEAAAFDRYLSIVPEAAVARKSGVGAVCAAGEGGVFHALWTLAERAGTGLEVFLKKIPIRQETVEVCNMLDVNPYEMAANGSLLCVTREGEALAESFRREGIPAEVIGFLTGENDRVIINGEERRFLEPAKEDSVYRILKI